MQRILVVDDDIDILELVKIVLTMNGYKVHTESRWENMDEAISNFSPSLILLDVSLGTADGRELCKKIKLKEDTSRIPVVLFSANIEVQKNLFDCQAQAFLSKPFEMKTLVRTIAGALNAS